MSNDGNTFAVFFCLIRIFFVSEKFKISIFLKIWRNLWILKLWICLLAVVA